MLTWEARSTDSYNEEQETPGRRDGDTIATQVDARSSFSNLALRRIPGDP